MTSKMRSYSKIIFTAIMAVIVMSASVVASAASDMTPAVDREASEAAFLRAYGYFLQNRVWNSLDELQESLRQNVYFVDAYYMRSLALRRLGRYTDAIDAMSQYLEVRRDDIRARIILDTIKHEWDVIGQTIFPEDITSAIAFDSNTINTFLKLPVYNPLSLNGMAGIGKIVSAGDEILLCDTLGDKVWIFGRGNKNAILNVDISRPAAIIPRTSSEAMLFLENGEVYRLDADIQSGNTALESEGSLNSGVSDAAFIDSTLIAVSDRRGGAIRFIEIPSLEQIAEWKPSDSDRTEKLFEPVAAASYGPLLAVADRGNGRVFVLDSYTMAELDTFAVASPRDLEWGTQGELYVLNELGTLYSRYPIGSASADVKIVAEGMKDAWSMSWAKDGPIITSVSGRTWWSGTPNPGHREAFGAVSLHDPWIETTEDGTEMLMMRGAVSSTFQSFIQDKSPMTQVVWRGEVRPSRVTEVGSSSEGDPKYYAPSSDKTPDGDDIIRANSISDVMDDIADASRGGEPIPRVIVMDTRISGSDEQLALFLGFLLQQGIRLDLWSIGRPAAPLMCHISRLTLGHTYYTRALSRVPGNESAEWILSVPLPPDLDTFGYPSDTTLSLFSDIDVIRFADWLPLWPSLIRRN